MLCLDKLGWPVEKIKGRKVVNFFRLLLHTRKIRRGNIKDFNKELANYCESEPDCGKEDGVQCQK